MLKNHNNETIANSGRRQFLNRVWAFFGIVAVAELGWLGLSFLNSRKQRKRADNSQSIIVVGAIDQFVPGTVTAIPGGQFYLACLTDGSFLALSRVCTHLGCSVLWAEEKGQFLCPCHGSSFSLTGEVLTAPAPRPMDIFPIRIENGILKVDISSKQKREQFDPAQTARL
jgi:nitrite reductase/ring-hydroxylating ferredoxin subunit